MFNLLEHAAPVLAPLCPQLDCLLTAYPQHTRWHTDSPAAPHEPISHVYLALLQTQTPSHVQPFINTANSPKEYRVYIISDLDTLTSQLTPAHQCYCTLTPPYQDPLHLQVAGHKDYRYNGWVCLLCSQVPSLPPLDLPKVHVPLHPKF